MCWLCEQVVWKIMAWYIYIKLKPARDWGGHGENAAVHLSWNDQNCQAQWIHLCTMHWRPLCIQARRWRRYYCAGKEEAYQSMYCKAANQRKQFDCWLISNYRWPINILPYKCTTKCVCRVFDFLCDKTLYLPLHFRYGHLLGYGAYQAK